jgi:tetratricopeptide (TPR) repeat protein
MRDDRNSQGDPAEPGDAAPSSRKTFLLRGVLFLSPFLLLLLIEAALRLFTAGGQAVDTYVNVSPFSVFSRESVDGVEYARITHRLAYAERNVRFQVHKPAGTVRLFCLGGSACAGWPHPAAETFSTYLQQALQRALPDRRVEVINAAAHGFASYRVRAILDEIVTMDPDAILIYCGNNEFLEKREYATVDIATLDKLADKLRTVQWLRSRLMRHRTELPADDLKDVALFFWKKVKQQALELREDPEQFAKVQAHYRYSMDYMIHKATSLGIPVLLCTVPVNLRDWLPAVSHNGLVGSELTQWQGLYDSGRRCLLEGRFDEGEQLMTRALDLEPEHAESWFWLGRLQEGQGRFLEALQSYSRARDLDYNPFRAISAFNRTLRDLAGSMRRVFLVDLEDAFHLAAHRGLPGFDLFLDYVHPNTQGNLLIAREIYRVLATQPVLEDRLRIADFSRGEVPVWQDGLPYDDVRDPGIQTRLFGLFAMNHQYEAALGVVRHLYNMLTGEDLAPAETGLPDSFPPEIREGFAAFHRYEAAERRALLGQDPGELAAAEAQLQTFYEKWYKYGRF